MKVRSQKLISLFLVLIMLVTMIPAGIFTANAANTVSISTATEWNAASGKLEDGDTVVLTTDIDFRGGEALPLVTAEQGALNVQFNGGGFTVKNATASAPLIAVSLASSAMGGDPGTENEFPDVATIQNVTFEKIEVTAETGDAALMVGTLIGNSMDFKFENIKVVDCDVTATAGSAATLVAKHEIGAAATGVNNPSTVVFNNITVDGASTVTANIRVGGVLGYTAGSRNANYKFTNVFVAASITSTYQFVSGTTDQYASYVGGIVGYFAYTGASNYTLSASFEKCAVKGSLILANKVEKGDGGFGGLVGYASLNSKTANHKFTFKDVAVDLSEYTADITKSSSLASIHNSPAVIVVYDDSAFVVNAPTNELYLIYNKYYAGSNAEENLHSGKTHPTLTTKTNFLVRFNENGFISEIVEGDPATCAHTWSEYVMTPATQGETGTKFQFCPLCGTDQTELIPALGYTVAEFLEDYENISAVNVTSDADWAALAAANKTFEGKTVQLANDISGITAPLAATFKGTFHGKDHTISNSEVSGKGVIANELYGGATVQNVKFENVDLSSSAEAGMIAGTFTPAATGDKTTIAYITIDSTSSVAATSSNAGGLFGTVPPASNYTLACSNLSLKMSVSGSKTGGLIGYEGATTSKGNTKGYITVTNALIAPTSAVTGGVLGYYGRRTTKSNGVQGVTTVTTSLTSCRVTLTNVIVAPQSCTASIFGSSGEYILWSENLFVTSETITGGATGFNNYYNGMCVGRTKTITAFSSPTESNGAGITENLPKVVTLAVAKASAKYDTNGFVTHIVETDPSKCNHAWSGYVTITPATKEDPGLEMRTCTNCNLEETREIPALGYTIKDFLDDYENQPTFVIKTVEDWEAIAESEKDFNDKTIQLGADINFEGKTAPTLVPFTTTVKFDGNGYTIKNVGSENNPQTVPLIATAITSEGTNTKDPSSDYDLDFSDEMVKPSSVKNVTFENVTMKAEGNIALVATEMKVTNKQSYVFENILVKNCDITSTTGAAAAILAMHNRGASSWRRSIITFTNITLDSDTTITGFTHVAGLLAGMSGTTHSAYGAKNVYVAATLTSTYTFSEAIEANRIQNQQNATVGGLFGKMSSSDSTRPCSMLIEDCAITGSLIIQNANHAHHGALGAVFGYAAFGNAGSKCPGFTLKNVVVDLVDFSDDMTYLASFGVVQNNTKGFVLSYVDCYVGNAPTNEIYQVYQVCYINSNAEENLLPSANQRDFTDIVTIGLGTAGDYIHLDVKGFITYVEDYFYSTAYQPGNNGTAIRFIAATQLSQATLNSNIKLHVTGYFTDATGGGKRFAASCELLDLLNVYNAYGITEEKTASDLGGKKLMALTIYNIPVGRPITFVVTTSYVNQYGTTVQSHTALTVVCDAYGAVTSASVNPIN